MCCLIPTLKEAFPSAYVGLGVFSAMSNAPWSGTIDNLELDCMFISENGERLISPIVNHFMTDSGVTSQGLSALAHYVLTRFRTQWTRKYNLLSLSYAPIENYNMEENETNHRTETHTGTDTTARTDSVDKTDTNSGTSSANGTSNTYGFNTAEAVPADTQTEQNTMSSTLRTVGTNTISDTQTVNKTDGTEETHSLTRHGNIGVTTSQQMAQSEIELWNWNFISDVFKDTASILSIPIY